MSLLINGAFVFKSKRYKVSLLIYGANIVLASDRLVHHIKLYIKYLRPTLIDDKHRLDRERYFFVASGANTGDKKVAKLKHATLTWCLTRYFERTGLFKGQNSCIKGSHARELDSEMNFSSTS